MHIGMSRNLQTADHGCSVEGAVIQMTAPFLELPDLPLPNVKGLVIRVCLFHKFLTVELPSCQ